MSHLATAWAIQQRGIDPATKLVLWWLADRHNKDTGRCDPSQEKLAEDCEMSRRSVNTHLKILEDKGIIERIQRSDLKTKRKISTFYRLFFENDNPQDVEKPCADIAHRPCAESGKSRVQPAAHKPVIKPKIYKNDFEREDTPADKLSLCALLILSGGYVSSSMFSPSMAREMIGRKLVTEAQLRKTGVSF